MTVVIKAVYDNGGKTFDRYSIYIDKVEKKTPEGNIYTVLGCSSNPTSPQGFSQFSTGMLGSHNGKKIAFSDLPKNVLNHVKSRLGRTKPMIEKKNAGKKKRKVN